MNLKITEERIAKEAGVSKASVSRYFNPIERNRLRHDTKCRIISVVEKYGFLPQQRTAQKRKYRTGVIGLLVPLSADLFESVYHRTLLAGIMEALEKGSYDLRFIPMRDHDYQNIRQFLRKYLVDGLIVLTWRSHPNLIKLVEGATKPIPLMLINDYEETVRANVVYCDVREGIEKAVGYLSGKGRRRIAFLKGPAANPIGKGEDMIYVNSIDSHEKFEGFKKAMNALGIPVRSEWIKECRQYTGAEGHKSATELFGGEERPDSVICSNDALAMGILTFLKDNNISCPSQVSVVGFDGIDDGRFSDPPLTTIRQPLKEMGEAACEKLIEIAEGKCFSSGAMRFRFSPELVVRESA